MQTLIIAGNVGNVKNVRDAGGDRVLNFSIAVDNGKDKHGEKREPTWFDCALWGKRADALAPHIAKGSKLCVSGRPSARAHEGKAYLGLTVSDLTFMSSRQDGGSDAREPAPPARDSYDLNDYSSDIPF
jgi:single-strand DNA-binding protein